MAFYPINLNVKNQRCLVIGGGQVAKRKVETLLSYQARVEIIAPFTEIVSELFYLIRNNRILHLASEYQSSLLQGVFLVFCATDSEQLNQRIASDAHSLGILVNVVDDPQFCTFTVPAVMHRGELTVSVSTGGNSPALARALRDKMEHEYGTEWSSLLNFLGQVRKYLLKNCSDPVKRRKVLSCLGQPEAVYFYQNNEGKEFEEIVWSLIKYQE